MKVRLVFYLIGIVLTMTACSEAKVYSVDKYQLMGMNTKRMAARSHGPSILVNQPVATAGFQSSRMRYIDKPFELSSFAKNAWVDTPANMVFPLIMQSLQNTGHFGAVVGVPYTGMTTYRLDVKVMKLVQNFVKKPSQLELVLKADVSSNGNHIIASKTFHQQITTPTDTPYGGVIAANQATQKVMYRLAQFVVRVTK